MDNNINENLNMPTISELRKELGIAIDSVAFQESRAVLNNLDTPVVAYCIGLAGFVAIYKLKTGFLKATSYTVKHMFATYPEVSFVGLNLMYAENIIRTNKLAVRRGIDEKTLAKLKTKTHKEKFVRPLIGQIDCMAEKDASNIHSYKIYGLKEKGKYVTDKDRYNYTARAFVDEYMNLISHRPIYPGGTIYKIVKNTVPFEVIGMIMRNNVINNIGSHPLVYPLIENPLNLIQHEREIWKMVFNTHKMRFKTMFLKIVIGSNGEIKRTVGDPKQGRDIYLDSRTNKEITKDEYQARVISVKV